MFKTTVLIALAALTCAPAAAHELWLERDDAGPVRIRLGEPADPAPDHGQDEFKRIKAPRVFGADGVAATAITTQKDHLQATLAAPGDAWMFDDGIFEPWKNDDGAYEAAAFHARAGRAGTQAKLDFELVPLKPGGDAYTVLFRGKPLAAAKVSVIDPQWWEKRFSADASGVLTVAASKPGRYLLVAQHREPVQREIGAKPVVAINHVATLSFVQP